MLKLRQVLEGKFFIMLMGIFLIAGLLYLMFFTPLLLVRNVLVTSVYKDIQVERLQAFLEPSMVNKNFLLLPFSEILKKTYDAFSELASLSCSRDFRLRQITCEAISFELVAVIKHEGEKYYMNSNGVVIPFDNRKLGLPIFDLVLNPLYAALSPDEPKSDQKAPEKKVFAFSTGKKILETEELEAILSTLESFEKVLKRKVINAKYIQVAAELSLTSKKAPKVPEESEEASSERPPPDSEESEEHEFTVLFDLRRDIEEQFQKLEKSQKVIDFSKVTKIDLSIDGEKVFYREAP